MGEPSKNPAAFMSRVRVGPRPVCGVVDGNLVELLRVSAARKKNADVLYSGTLRARSSE